MTSIKLTIPEPTITLYKDGFEGICQLNRKEDGKKLSDLVERIEDPLVIALDAPWGAGISEFVGPVIDVALEAGSNELDKASEEFWQKEDGKRTAMADFRGALTELALDQKLVIVVDELDRCRPDYALNLLEVIKHFFDVPNVHFVLGVNLKELENSVKARYGAKVNAEKYLQKFYNLQMGLTIKENPIHSTNDLLSYFNEKIEHVSPLDYKFELGTVVHLLSLTGKLPLRDVNQIITAAKMCPPIPDRYRHEHDDCRMPVATLLVLKTVNPSILNKVRNIELTLDEILQELKLTEELDPDDLLRDEKQSFKNCWEHELEGHSTPNPDGKVPPKPGHRAKDLLRQTVDVFAYIPKD